ncbi:VOC family protein [Altererythrobacter sp. Root672]|uniref:VOC family protein n=1 Tax=Altererythrobacter sp. Root672 TaxID=1736584 RepID=UPI0006F26C51|nr:VOC family protein [Altererythrobacter sp. Root672]KRA83096.1 3-demethylubiquinone-9 3-methyltransferase [Altererythrobacter sp. Root672]
MKATPFLMFQGDAAGALALYRAAFADFEELLLQEHPEGPQAGQVAMARIRVGGLEIMLYDSPPVHAFTFTPATSIFIECDDEAQLRALAETLGEGGGVMMPIGNYGFSSLFTWLADRFGVSWQLNLK